jgi:hypothetical protein
MTDVIVDLLLRGKKTDEDSLESDEGLKQALLFQRLVSFLIRMELILGCVLLESRRRGFEGLVVRVWGPLSFAFSLRQRSIRSQVLFV